MGNLGQEAMQFAFGIVLARLLTPADFGMIITIQVFTGFVGMVASGGMGQSLIRAKEASGDDFNAVFTLQILLGIAICSAFFVSAPLLVAYLHNPLYADLLRVSALSFLLRPFTLIQVSWLTRNMDFKKRALIDVAAGAAAGVLSVAMALAGMGVWSLVISGLVGGLITNVSYYCVTSLRLRLNFDTNTVRRHAGYGFKITANDFLGYIKYQSINLILAKMAGPAFLGIFNKAESLSRMPNRLLTAPTCQTVFRAMSMVQDDLDRTKYMFFRTITLLLVYITPMSVALWWVAEPFIGVVYGDKWLPAAEPLRILLLAGVLRAIGTPCGVVLAAQNRLMQEIVGQVLEVIFIVTVCLIGLKWGLTGVAWALLINTVFATVYGYVLVYRAIRTRATQLVSAVAPALLLNAILVAVLASAHYLLTTLMPAAPFVYLVTMLVTGFVVYVSAFLFLPISALRSETERWRRAIQGRFGFRP